MVEGWPASSMPAARRAGPGSATTGRLLAPGEFVPPAVVDVIGRQFDPDGAEARRADSTGDAKRLARIMREGVYSGRDTRASVWYKRSVYKRLATTEAPA